MEKLNKVMLGKVSGPKANKNILKVSQSLAVPEKPPLTVMVVVDKLKHPVPLDHM